MSGRPGPAARQRRLRPPAGEASAGAGSVGRGAEGAGGDRRDLGPGPGFGHGGGDRARRPGQGAGVRRHGPERRAAGGRQDAGAPAVAVQAVRRPAAGRPHEPRQGRAGRSADALRAEGLAAEADQDRRGADHPGRARHPHQRPAARGADQAGPARARGQRRALGLAGQAAAPAAARHRRALFQRRLRPARRRPGRRRQDPLWRGAERRGHRPARHGRHDRDALGRAMPADDGRRSQPQAVPLRRPVRRGRERRALFHGQRHGAVVAGAAGAGRRARSARDQPGGLCAPRPARQRQRPRPRRPRQRHRPGLDRAGREPRPAADSGEDRRRRRLFDLRRDRSGAPRRRLRRLQQRQRPPAGRGGRGGGPAGVPAGDRAGRRRHSRHGGCRRSIDAAPVSGSKRRMAIASGSVPNRKTNWSAASATAPSRWPRAAQLVGLPVEPRTRSPFSTAAVAAH